MGEGVSSFRRTLATLGGTALLAFASAPASAGPNEGEARTILRDADRVYTVVAGEADAAATVTNPGNLGYLQGLSAIVDFAWTARSSRRRGNGVGAMLGLPVFLPALLRPRTAPLFAIGLGYQWLDPRQPDAGGSEPDSPQNPDDPYSKITIALSVPLQRWVPGFSLGVNYSRLIAGQNFHANINQFDIAASYWPTRFLALGLVARGINVPQSGFDDGEVEQAFVLDPEIAFRPFGTPRLEAAAGVRYSPRVPGAASARFRTFHFEPRGRLFVRIGPARIFASVERMRWWPVDVTDGDASRDGATITGGVEVNLGHVGWATAVMTSANGPRAFSADGGAVRLRISQERYDGPKLSARKVLKLQLSKYRGDRGMWAVIQHLERASERSGDVLIETQGMSFSYAQIEEIREAVTRLRARGGKVYVYLQGGALRHYFLASIADKIIAHPTASLSILGMRIQTFYYGDLLAKLGAKAEFVRIAEYKATPEKYSLNTATPPSAAQRKMMVNDMWNHVLRTVANDRGHDALVIKEWIDEAPFHPPRALREGIVDALAWPDELDETLEGYEGKRVRIEKPSRQAAHADEYGEQRRIAVLLVDGDIVDGESFTIPVLNRHLVGSTTITKEIEKLRKDNGVIAIVVRINSPGGSVSASEAMARELDLAQKVKPVVISMGTTAASGGYYVATGGQYIYADATTATGSIGIFVPKFDLSEALEKVGVGVDRVDYGRRAGLRSWFKPFSADERAAAQQEILDWYSVFTGRVSKARSMTLARVDKVARGRVWSGVRAIDVGLVDAYGGLREAVLRARQIAGLRPDQGMVKIYPRRPTAAENLRRLLRFKIPWPLGKQAGAQPNGAYAEASQQGLFAIPPALRVVLRLLPAGLWLVDAPRPLALAEETIVIEG